MNAPKLNLLKRDEQSLRCRSSQVLGSKQCAINQCTRRFLSLKKTHVCFFSFFSGAFCGKTIHPTDLSEGTNRNLHYKNTLVQLLAMYIDPEGHNAQRYITDRQTGGRIDGRHDDANSRS